MDTVQIRLGDDLRKRLVTRATESGYASVEAYVEALIRADAGDDPGVGDDDLEDLLLQRLDSGEGVECTPAFIAQFKSEVARRRQTRGSPS
jgi:hypothetical protein